MSVFLLLLVLPACTVTSRNPLSDPAEATPDRNLFGQWKFANAEKGTVHLFVGLPSDMQAKERPAGFMVVHLLSINVNMQIDADREPAFFFVTRIGKDTFLNIDEPRDQTKPREYWILKYVVDGDTLTFWPLSVAAAEAIVKEGYLQGQVTKGLANRVVLTDTSKKLQDFIRDKGNKTLFSENEKIVFQRVK